jgi:hypothetical protein
MVNMLFPETRLQQADTVTFSFPEVDRLEAVITAASKTVSVSLQRRSGQFSCESGAVVVHDRAEWVHGVAPGPIAVVGGKSVTWKLKVVENYLIITRVQADFLWLPFPGRSTWTSWYRFQRVTP